jgi:hypothetical protein
MGTLVGAPVVIVRVAAACRLGNSDSPLIMTQRQIVCKTISSEES